MTAAAAPTREPVHQEPLRRLIRYTQPYRRRIWLASLCSVLNKIFDLAPPALIGAAVDVVVQQEDSFLSRLGIVEVPVNTALKGEIETRLGMAA